MLTSLGEALTEEDVDALMSNMSISKDGTVNCEEFVKTVMSA